MLEILFILVFASLAFQVFMWEMIKMRLKNVEQELRDLNDSGGSKGETTFRTPKGGYFKSSPLIHWEIDYPAKAEDIIAKVKVDDDSKEK